MDPNHWKDQLLGPNAVLALESFAECTGKFAPNATIRAAVESALLRHFKFMNEQVAAEHSLFWTDVWGSARYSEVLVGIQWSIYMYCGTC